ISPSSWAVTRTRSWAGFLLNHQPSLGCREPNPCCYALDEAAGVVSEISRTIMLDLSQMETHSLIQHSPTPTFCFDHKWRHPLSGLSTTVHMKSWSGRPLVGMDH
ncbi:unnamed protein product, partial [Musa hybrid cultivar]